MAGAVKARDVRDAVKEYGFERGVITILERMCDERAGDRNTMRDVVELINQCIENVDKMVNVGDAMGAKLKEVERREQQYRETDHIPPSNE